MQLLVPSSPHLIMVIHLPSSLHAMCTSSPSTPTCHDKFMVHHLLPLSSLFYDLIFSHSFHFLLFSLFLKYFKNNFFDIANQLGPLIHKHDTKYSFEVHVACELYKLAQGINLLICSLMNFSLLVDL